MSQLSPHKMTRVTGATEALIIVGPCRLIQIIPDTAATTGTVTVRDAAAIGLGGTAKAVIPAAINQSTGYCLGAGDLGVLFQSGITVQLSVGGDAVNVVWNTLL